MVQAYDVGHAINPTLVEGQIEGGAMMGLGPAAGAVDPHYLSIEGRGNEFGGDLMPGLPDFPETTSVIVENPSEPTARSAPRRSAMAKNAQGPVICSATHDAVGVWVPESRPCPECVPRALRAKAEGTMGACRGARRWSSTRTSAYGPWRTRPAFRDASAPERARPVPQLEPRPGDRVPPGRAPARIGGEQVRLCKATTSRQAGAVHWTSRLSRSW